MTTENTTPSIPPYLIPPPSMSATRETTVLNHISELKSRDSVYKPTDQNQQAIEEEAVDLYA